MTRRERGRREGLQEGAQIGRIEGRAEGVRGLTLKLLQRRLGAVSETLTQRLTALPAEQLEQLGLDSLDFASVDDLAAWLEQHTPNNPTAH